MANRALVIGAHEYPEAARLPSTSLKLYESIKVSAEGYRQALETDPLWGPGSCVLLLNPRTPADVWAGLDACTAAMTGNDRLLVVYIGHGAYWTEVPGGSVHLGLSASVDGAPDTWLSTWYLYWKMRGAQAGLKVLIADCCYSGLMGALGGAADPAGKMPPPRGTAVFTSLGGAGSTRNAGDPDGCPHLGPEWDKCTLFSGHFLKVLAEGVPGGPYLTLGSLRDAVETAMTVCTTHEDHLPRLVTKDAREDQPLFTNKMFDSGPERGPSPLRGRHEWVATLSQERGRDLTDLLRSPGDAASVQLRLAAVGTEIAWHNVRRISKQADDKLTPAGFARYQAELRRGWQA
jgi:hypothetical protein